MNDNTQTQNDQAKFFDLHTSGIGYLNRSRTVNPTQGNPYESVSIAALHGRSDSPSYSYFDTRVVGSDALDFIKQNKDAINDRASKVLVRFKVGDGTAASYEVKSGDNKGARNHIIKSRLLKITWASINGEVVLQTDQPVPVDEGRSSMDSTNGRAVADQPPVEARPVESSEKALPAMVQLDPNDPEFESRRTRLKKAGYRWNRDQAAWVLTEAA